MSYVMVSIYLTRHGESTWNVERRWAGHADPPLSEAGRQQARSAGDKLNAMDFLWITSSQLRRARETAEIISNQLEIPLRESLAEFNERHGGKFSGLTSPEIESQFPGLLERWRTGESIEIPDGELWHTFVNRVLRGLNCIAQLGGERVLVITHEGVLRAVENQMNEPHQKHRNLEGRWIQWTYNNCMHPTAGRWIPGEI